MKTTLILTDFSKKSENAAELGVMLSSKLHTDVLLFNTMVTNASQAYTGIPWVGENIIWGDDDSKDNLNKLAIHLKPLVEQLEPGDKKPIIYCNNGAGNLSAIIPDIIRNQNDIELIMMGARTKGNNADDFFGSDLEAVIQKSTRPILVVPHKTDIKELKKVIFATNFDDADLKALHFLVKLGRLLNFQLQIIHVCQPGKLEMKSTREREFEENLSRLKYPGIVYREIKGADVVQNIINLYDETGADMLAMVHHQYSFFMRKLHQSSTKKVLYDQQIPLLIFPSTMD